MDCLTGPIVPQSAPSIEISAETRERRRWIRFVIPELVTRVGWQFGGKSESHIVNLVKVDGEGAVVVMDREPPGDQTCVIHFENGRPGALPIPARLASTEALSFGRVRATFQFDLTRSTAGGVPKNRERRAWRRVVPKETRATLSWISGDSRVAIDARLEDIGGGGAAVKVGHRPPIDETVWLSVGREGKEAGPVECRLVGCDDVSHEESIARLAFVELCPMDVFVIAMGLNRPG